MDALLPLINYQYYIRDSHKVESCPPGSFNFHTKANDRNPEAFYEHTTGWPGDVRLKKRYFEAYFRDMGMGWILNSFKRSQPWLTAPRGEKFDVVAHIPTHKMCREKEEWSYILKQLSLEGHEVVVIGGDDVSDWEDSAECYKPRDMLEAASLIGDAKMFIGTASCNYVIAEGIGTLRFVDIHPDAVGTKPSEDNGWDISDWPADVVLKRLNECLRNYE
tara:strand:+ start:3707 stop:4363 length:657 start_codon:yes stop_codon:yes gene_type:complete